MWEESTPDQRGSTSWLPTNSDRCEQNNALMVRVGSNFDDEARVWVCAAQVAAEWNASKIATIRISCCGSRRKEQKACETVLHHRSCCCATTHHADDELEPAIQCKSEIACRASQCSQAQHSHPSTEHRLHRKACESHGSWRRCCRFDSSIFRSAKGCPGEINGFICQQTYQQQTCLHQNRSSNKIIFSGTAVLKYPLHEIWGTHAQASRDNCHKLHDKDSGYGF